MNNDLAKRAIACKDWRWMPGMRHGTSGSRMLCTGDDLDGPWQAWSDEDYDACACKLRPDQTANDLPDLTDPATLGALLALVREAWGMPRLVAIPQPDGEWSVWGLTSIAGGETEAAALVAALEAAP